MLALAAAALAALPAHTQGAPALEPGPHAVGFRSTWILDVARTYRTAFDGGATYGAEEAPRPVLALLWYPAEESDESDGRREPLPHSAYLELPRDDERLAPLADALADHARKIAVELVMGKPEAELDAGERALLDELLAEPTACVAGAEPAAGPFPLVLHHSGAGSSFEDDAARCAWLASRGYAVVTSAYVEADGSDLGIDGQRGSAADARELVRWASGLPFVDATRVGLVGHSAGAQAWLRFAAEPGCVADALVLLDTTQDYYDPGMPLHADLVAEVRAGVEHLARPMLLAAGPEAAFLLADELVHAERTYLTVPQLGHDEYVAQGMQRLARIERQGASGPDASELGRIAAARASHVALWTAVAAFLDAELRGARAELDALVARDAASPWTPHEPRLLRVPRGASGPGPWDPASDLPPTPRQWVRLVLAEGGADDARDVLARFRDAEPRGPLFTSTMLAGSLLHRLVADGRIAEARSLHETFAGVPLDALGVLDFLARISVLRGRPEEARALLRMAFELDPDDRDRAARLRELEGG